MATNDVHQNSSFISLILPINNTASFRNSSMTFNTSTGPKPLSSNQTIFVVIRAIIAIVGSIGNLCLLTAAWKDRTSRPGTRILILNLAATSLLHVTLGQPVAMAYQYRSLPNPCPFSIFGVLLVTTANWSDVSLAFNRMVAVCYPHYYSQMSTRKAGCALWIGTWSLGGVIVGLIASGLGSEFREVRSGVCIPVTTSLFGGIMSFATLPVPLVVFGLVILRIMVALLAEHKRRNRVAVAPASRKRGVNRKRALARAMIASFAWCLCSTVPYTIIFNLFPQFSVNYPDGAGILRLVFWSEYAINPVSFGTRTGQLFQNLCIC